MSYRKTNIKQHYVPQFYLKRFTSLGESLFVYDTIRNLDYLSSPKKECQSRYFYDVETEILKKFSTNKNLSVEIVDDKIRLLNEDKASLVFKLLYDNVCENENGYDFLQEDREHFYNFLLLQFLRTPFYRQRLGYFRLSFALRMDIKDLDESDYLNVIHNLLLFGLIEKLFDVDFNLNKDYHNFFDNIISELLYVRRQIECCEELFLVNKTTHKFLTSNSPVKIQWKSDPYGGLRGLATPMDRNKPIVDVGYLSEISTVYIPIGPNLSVFLFDKGVGEAIGVKESGIGIIEEYNSDLILNLNYSMFLNSPSKVFSSTKDFSEYVEMKNNKTNPRYNFNFSGDRNVPDDIRYF